MPVNPATSFLFFALVYNKDSNFSKIVNNTHKERKFTQNPLKKTHTHNRNTFRQVSKTQKQKKPALTYHDHLGGIEVLEGVDFQILLLPNEQFGALEIERVFWNDCEMK